MAPKDKIIETAALKMTVTQYKNFINEIQQALRDNPDGDIVVKSTEGEQTAATAPAPHTPYKIFVEYV